MADNSFRSSRNRDALARVDAGPLANDGGVDPLAELARLIGQSDAVGGFARNGRHTGEAFDEAAATANLAWATSDDGYAEPSEEYVEQSEEIDDRYAPPPPGSWAHGESSSDEFAEADQYSDHPEALGHGPDNARAAMVEDFEGHQQPGATHGYPPPLAYEDHNAAADHSYEEYGTQAYAAEGYVDGYDAEPSAHRLRGAIIMVMSLLGLVVIGSASAMGYRAMFGGLMLPTLPPIIKAATGPNKIIPNRADGQSADATPKVSTEKLVPHQEQPVDIPPPSPPPRAVSTVPVAPAAPGPDMAAAQPAVAPAPAPAPVPPSAPAPSAAFAAAASFPMPLPSPAASTEPKKVHTVTIRTDPTGGSTNAVAGQQQATAARPKSHQAAAQPAAQPAVQRSDAPLSLAPGAAPTRMATTEQPSASTATYAVQVTSQRSEGSAQAVYRSLQAKYPDQLGGRRAIMRRADLGTKGVYYRALVGPFASVEEAAGLCSGLKAAGGNCIVEKN